MAKKKRNITIYDIADKLEISVSTVSRALHDDRRISKEVTERVKNAAAAMGYTPNTAARSLRTGKSNTVGLIVRDINDEWYASIVPSIEKNCASNGLGLLLCNADNRPEGENFYIKILRQRRVDGILILTPVHPTQDAYIEASKLVPMVLVDLLTDDPKINTVSVDHTMGAYTAAKHLIDLGHKEIAFMIGPINLSSSLAYIDGYKQAMLDSGFQWKEDHLHIGPQTTIDEGQKAFQKFWQLNPRPTAVASGSDFMAAGLMRTAQKSGVRVPEDLSIIGYDDIPLSSLLSPPLTTILQDKEKLGEEAIRLLLESMKPGKKEYLMVTIPPKLVVRDSTAPFNKG